jgi:hypothetical protein
MGKDGWFLGKELSRGGAEGLTLTPLFAPLTNTLLKMNTLTEARHPFCIHQPFDSQQPRALWTAA